MTDLLDAARRVSAAAKYPENVPLSDVDIAQAMVKLMAAIACLDDAIAAAEGGEAGGWRHDVADAPRETPVWIGYTFTSTQVLAYRHYGDWWLMWSNRRVDWEPDVWMEFKHTPLPPPPQEREPDNA